MIVYLQSSFHYGQLGNEDWRYPTNILPTYKTKCYKASTKQSMSHKAIDERINESHKEIIITRYSHERIARVYKTPESRVNSINDATTGIHDSNLRLHTAEVLRGFTESQSSSIVSLLLYMNL